MKRYLFVFGILAVSSVSMGLLGQTDPSKNYENCAYWELIEQLRAYEDTLAFEQSLPDTLRREYGIPVTNNGITAKVYRLYRCAALLDTLANRQDSLAFVRADPPTVDSDSISGITISSAILHGRVLSDGGETVTERWFKYGTSLTALNDTITAVVGVPDSIFTANLTGLTPPGTWYMAAVAKNAKGTSSGDTLQFITVAAPTMDTDSSSLRTATTATLHGKVITNGGDALTHQWFRYGTSAAALNDSIAASGAGSGTPPLTSPFSAGLTGLTAATKYYFAAFGKNAAGTAAGDTLSFWTKCSVDSVSYDGHWYGVVLVGDKCWFDENLKSDQYRNGNLIPGNLDSLNWVTTLAGAQAVQDQGGPNEAANLDTYGRLYNFHAVNDSRGLCPAGWDVPTNAEWDSLYARVGGEAVAGKELKAPAPRWNGVNTNGFDVVQGGRRMPDATFAPVGGVGYAYFWTSTPNGGQAYYRYFTQYVDAYGYFNGLRNGFSVRCIQDSTTLSAPVVRTDSISSITSTTATFHGRVLSDGGETVTERWFKYGTSRTALNDTITAVVGVPDSIFTANITGLTPP